jgi:hypothetical protein
MGHECDDNTRLPDLAHTCWQARYTAGTKEILRRTFEGIPLNPTDVIVQARLIWHLLAVLGCRPALACLCASCMLHHRHCSTACSPPPGVTNVG